MSGDPTYRIFDELSSDRFSVTQPGRLAFFENLLFQIVQEVRRKPEVGPDPTSELGGA